MNDLLTIEHEDFTLRVDCTRFEQVWARAMGNMPKEALRCHYSWDKGVRSIAYRDKVMEGEEWDAVFFDNTVYPVWVDFKGNDVTEAFVMANRQKDYENFDYHKEKHVLSGFLNYGNEIGKTELELRYVKEGRQKCWSIRYEVLSQKLDYHNHWKAIVEEIEQEYRMLSLDFLKKTYHGFNVADEAENKDLIWWNIFKDKQAELVKNVKLIIERPKLRLRDKTEYRRADQLKRLTPRLEQEFAEHKRQVEYHYMVDVPQLNRDTMENRFLKYVVRSVARRHEALSHKVLSYEGVSKVLKKEIGDGCKELQELVRNPFFRGIGDFKGLTQESLTLQKATGYSQVYRIWLLLSRAYDLNDGMFKLESKDIATLYEIWCYIEVRHVVEQLLKDKDVDITVDDRSRIEMNSAFSYELDKGRRSRIIFRKGDIELAELIYNPKEEMQENGSTGIEDVVSRTVPQRPDIVLQLTKHDTKSGMKLTYLFDAKYRLGEKQQGTDTPPDDAINQMHRYRDALFYSKQVHNKCQLSPADLKREVVGGYILFPGDGETNNIKLQVFYRSIKEVNIGAFPLRPKDEKNRELLVDFVRSLIQGKTWNLIGNEHTIPQKGLRYVMPGNDLVMVARVRNEAQREWVWENKWYNIPLEKMVDSPMMEAKYLLLIKNGEKTVGNLCKLVKTRYDVWTKDRLLGEGYPHAPNHDNYFMLRIKSPKETDETLRNMVLSVSECSPEWGNQDLAFFFVRLHDFYPSEDDGKTE